MIYGYIDVAIFDSYSVGTASKKFDWDGIVVHEKLYALKGNHSPFVVGIGHF